jgi:NAD(P)-dependent dehydrogenase (short-subunit alcohol dehydrogenase family)
MRDHAACRDAIAQVVDALGPPDVLAHIAGIVRPTRIGAVTPEEVELVFDVNLKGSVNICQAVLPEMRSRRAGSIALMSSVAAQRGGGVFGGAHYSASKAGVLGLARAMARELAPEGVRVNAVAPGPVDTEILGGPMTDAQRAAFAAAVPMGRIGTTTDVAGCFLFLASALSAYVTGAVIDVNGGLHIH